jgi:DNA-binding CsgD family transcriptional regulator
VFAPHVNAEDDRGQVDRFVRRQVWSRIDERDRRLLEYAAFLPEIDAAVLTSVGFADARSRWQRLVYQIPFVGIDDGCYVMHEVLRDFVRRAVAGGPPAAYRALIVTIGRALERAGADPGRSEAAAPAALTPAESYVLRAIAEGQSNREIALASGRSENTVRVHVSAVLRKLGARSRTEAVAIARRNANVA